MRQLFLSIRPPTRRDDKRTNLPNKKRKKETHSAPLKLKTNCTNEHTHTHTHRRKGTGVRQRTTLADPGTTTSPRNGYASSSTHKKYQPWKNAWKRRIDAYRRPIVKICCQSSYPPRTLSISLSWRDRWNALTEEALTMLCGKAL